MLCQSCKKNIATTHIKTVSSGDLTEYLLCSDCAQSLGYLNPMNLVQLSLNKILSHVNILRCSQCGTSFDEILANGKIGCAHCYQTFQKELMPSIQRIHGNTSHVGKIPSCADQDSKIKSQIKNLKKQMDQAVLIQNFEHAAELRDQIKNLEQQVRQDG